MAHTIAMSLIPYVFAHVPLAGSYSHVVAFVVVLLYLFAMHTYRMITDYGGWTMDITGPLMLIAVKSSAFAFNVADGRRKSTELSAEQQRYAVAQVPSLLEYLGFIYFFAGFVAGPSFELTDYLTLSNRTTATTPPHSAHITALRRLLTGLLCMSGVILNGQYPLSLTTQSFFVDDWSFLQRCGFVFFFVSLQRFKYYFAWKLAEGSCIASGLCVEKDGSCEGITNINILGVEFSTSFKGIADNWNIGIAKWLKRYIYLRLSPSGKNVPLSTTVTTYLTSAFWHGPYPGYALFFGLAAVITDLARSLRRHLRPFVMKADGKTPKSIKPLYDIAGWALSIFCLNYAAVPFVLLNIDDSLTYYSAMKYCVHIGLVIVFILYKFLGFGRIGVTKVKKTQ